MLSHRILIAAALAMAGQAVAVDGTIPNLAYSTNQLFQQISPQLSTRHLNQPSVFNGYLVLAGNAVHEVWDISNPYAPVRKATMTSPFSAGEAESHQVTYARTANGTTYMATTSGKGVDIWNMTVTTHPVLVAAVQLPNINYGDVSGAIWGLSWQGNYLYLGATTFGLYIVRVSNPAQPAIVKIFNQSQLGGVAAGPVFALGNLLVVTTPKDFSGIATVDISDPANPRLLDAVVGGSSSYIGGFYGGNAYLITPLRAYDVTTDPRNIQLVASAAVPNSEYVSFADNFLFLGGVRGGTEGIYKYAMTNPASPVLVGRYVGRNPLWDDQFSCPIGNLLAVADDQLVTNQYVGGLLAVHDVNPDTTPPTVLNVFPGDGAENQPLTTRVAVSLSEWPELATVNSASMIVRPLGGQPLAGIWSCTCSTLNFSPTDPLLPYTTYEILLPAGGVKDFVGNSIASEFRATFHIGSGVTGFPGDLQGSPVPPTKLGGATAFSLAQPPAPGAAYEWNFGDGNTNSGASVSHTYAAPGRYTVTLRGTQLPILFEAENAQLSGGVVVASDHPGFTGAGFADYPGATGTNVFVRWEIVLQGAATANFSFRYANAGTSNRPLNLVINGGPPSIVPFPMTGAWTTYATISHTNAALVTGANTIELQASAGSVGPNVDSALVSFPGAEPLTTSFTHIVHRPLTTNAPAHSQPMTLDSTRATLWVANPDTDTVTAVDAASLAKRGEYMVGDQPESLGQAPDGTIWVANHGSATISILNTNGSLAVTLPLPRASQPYGLVFAPKGSNTFVALQVLGRIVKLDSASRTVVSSLDLPADPNGIRPQVRGVAINGDGDKLFVTRFLSPDSGGQVFEINPNTMALVRTLFFTNDPGPDTPGSSRGIPNYLNAIAISPDGARAWVPSKKDNIQRGQVRDGNLLTHDMTVRSITSVFDPATGLELLAERTDYDDRDRAHAVCFSPLGDLAFVSMPGNNHVQVVDAYAGVSVTQLPTGKSPTGVLFEAVAKRLYVLNFLSRSVSAYDVGDLINGINKVAAPLGAPIPLVAVEKLATNVLRGKELFYDATSTRLNEEGYMSCASCHLDGSHDGRVWDFTGSGEGLRNTIDLRGRAGTAHGRLHWSANFDEVQDFEGQIRNFGSGAGLMDNTHFTTGTRWQPLGLAKHGLSADLDALSAYVTSLINVPRSPYRNADGTLTSDGIAGRKFFNQLNCFTCHGGEYFTDSSISGYHNVGTLKTSSGQRLGAPLTGLDTPTLRGIWATAPYLHDGSAPTLLDVLTTANPTNAHGATGGLSPAELAQLAAYLNQIDDIEPPALPAAGIGVPGYSNYVAFFGVPPHANGPLDNPDNDRLDNVMEYALGASNPTDSNSRFPIVTTLVPMMDGTNVVKTFHFSLLRRAGGFWLTDAYRIGDLEYWPQASSDLSDWNLPLIEMPNPAELSAPPSGYEWVTYELPPASGGNVRGFGRLKVGLK